MPIWKFRSVEEMDRETWRPIGDPALHRAIRAVWELADRMCPRSYPPGVYKFRTIEEANRQRDAWEEANFQAHWRRQREGASGSGRPPG